jgi:hypothetical protein
VRPPSRSGWRVGGRPDARAPAITDAGLDWAWPIRAGLDGPALVILWQRVVSSTVLPVPWSATLLLGAMTWAGYRLDRALDGGRFSWSAVAVPLAVALVAGVVGGDQWSTVHLTQGVPVLALASARLVAGRAGPRHRWVTNTLTAVALVAGICWPLPLAHWPVGPMLGLALLFGLATTTIDRIAAAERSRGVRLAVALTGVAWLGAGLLGHSALPALVGVTALCLAVASASAPPRPPDRLRVLVDVSLLGPPIAWLATRPAG